MKAKPFSFLIGGILLTASASTGWCTEADPGRISAAETQNIQSPLAPHILHYLLGGKGTVSGLVWNDLNGNGTPDENEYGIAEVLVYIDIDNNAAYSDGEPAQLTDEKGLYTITGIKPGIKDVTIDTASLPQGFGITTSYPLALSIAPHKTLPDIDFGARDQSAKIIGTLWDQTADLPIAGVVTFVDLNGDGKATYGEPRATTNARGHYLIANLSPGDYVVRIDNTSLDPKYHRTPVSGTNPTQVFLPSLSTRTVDLAYLHKATICGTLRDEGGRQWGGISIFIDLNSNGVYDAGEPLAMTDPTGKFCFDELFPGTYTLLLREGQLPDGYSLLHLPGSVTLGAGDDTTANFVTHQPVTISGLVWNDASGNRVREPAENGLSGVTVFLDANNNGGLDGGETTAVSDGAGAFTFSGLSRGPFSIRVDETPLAKEYIRTTASNPVFITLEPGQVYDGARFGYQKKLEPMHSLQYPNRLSWNTSGNLYVSDFQVNAVFIFDRDQKLTGELKNLDKPLGIVSDAEGNIYVGNQGRHNVESYDAQGNLRKIFGDGNIAMPNDLALDRDDNLYVLDSAGRKVQVYNQAGDLINSIGGPPWTGFAYSIAIGYRGPAGSETGELYVADSEQSTIHIYSLDGSYLKSIGGPGSRFSSNWDGKFSGLTAVTIDRYGNIHGLDNNLNVVQVFEPQNGTMLRSYNAYLPGNASRLNLQSDIAIQPADQRVAVSNLATDTVEIITTITAP